MKDVDIVSYSAGPGLGPCLRVGAVVARTVAGFYKKPLVPVNHLEGHVYATQLEFGPVEPPLVALIVGILILVVPRLLNFLVAIYLIIVGVSGLWPHLLR